MIASWWPIEAPDALGVFDAIDAVLALAVVAEGRGLDDRRQCRRAERDGELVERDCALANGVTGKPRSARNAFSRARCCVMCSAAPLGRTGTSSAAASAASVDTFSNSNVTTSTPRANARMASRSS